jgi:hypothetical protein
MMSVEQSVEWQLVGEPTYPEKNYPRATFSTTNPTWRNLGSNLGRRGGKPVTNRLSYGTAWIQSMYTFKLVRKMNMNDVLNWRAWAKPRNPLSGLPLFRTRIELGTPKVQIWNVVKCLMYFAFHWRGWTSRCSSYHHCFVFGRSQVLISDL